MELSIYRESSKPVATCDRSALFGFTKLDSAEILRGKKASAAMGTK